MADLRAAFLDAVLADPDDDVCRLVFADWLDEHGDEARAEFVRLQIDLARDPRPDGRRERADELLLRHRADWLPGCEGIDWMVSFRRGFGEVVEVPAGGGEVFAARAGRLFAHSPIVEATLDAAPDLWPDMMRWDYLRRLRVLRVADLRRPGVAPLVESGCLTGLRRLDLGRGQIGVGGLELLLGSRLVRQLQGLSLAGNRTTEQYDWDEAVWTDGSVENVGPLGVVDLAASAAVAGLAKLDVSWNAVEERAAYALATSPHLGGLRELRVAERGTVTHDSDSQTQSEEASPLSHEAAEALRQRYGRALRLWPDHF